MKAFLFGFRSSDVLRLYWPLSFANTPYILRLLLPTPFANGLNFYGDAFIVLKLLPSAPGLAR